MGHREQRQHPGRTANSGDGGQVFAEVESRVAIHGLATAELGHPAYLLWVLEGLLDGQVINQITVPEETKRDAQVALNQMLALR